MIRNQLLHENHLIKVIFPLEDKLLNYIKNDDWKNIDNYFLREEKINGKLFNFLKNYLDFNVIEHIISIREAPDEDGIWHDDGSRILGFTLSLTHKYEDVVGGHLLFRKKNSADITSIPLQPLGTMLLFKTGIYGFEHMVTEVTKGKRVLIAGWCS